MRGYLLDTNIVSELRKGLRANSHVISWFQSVDENELFVSVLVLGEIRGGIERIRRADPNQARALERWLNGLVTVYSDRVLSISATVADRWGRLNASGPLPVIDTLMAATAMENDLTLVTRNIQDVMRTGARAFDPFQSQPRRKTQS